MAKPLPSAHAELYPASVSYIRGHTRAHTHAWVHAMVAYRAGAAVRGGGGAETRQKDVRLALELGDRLVVREREGKEGGRQSGRREAERRRET